MTRPRNTLLQGTISIAFFPFGFLAQVLVNYSEGNMFLNVDSIRTTFEGVKNDVGNESQRVRRAPFHWGTSRQNKYPTKL